MPFDREQFIVNYTQETEENIREAEGIVVQLRKEPDNEELLAKVLRLLHTVKGSSRMLNFDTVEKISHGLESLLKAVQDGRMQIDEPFAGLFFAATDTIDAALKKIHRSGEDLVDCTGLCQMMEQAERGAEYDPGRLTGDSGQNGSAEEQEPDEDEPVSLTAQTVRVNVRSIEQLIEMVQNLIVKQFQLKKFGEQLYDPEGAVSVAGHQASADRRLEKYNKMFKEHFNTIERESFSLLEHAYTLRMLPVHLILSQLPRMVEETAISLSKEVVLKISGEHASLDRSILELLQDPLIHLVRNAVDHGMETPEERRNAGKNSTGTLEVSCKNQGQSILISIRDDGRGIDFEKIRQKAIRIAPHNREEIEAYSEQQLLPYLFEAGFSTKDSVSTISGRGVGLDIVKKNLEAAKGKIDVHSVPGEGTTFELLLPLSLATVSGFFAEIHGMLCYIPADYIEEIILLKNAETVPLHNIEGVRYRDKVIPKYRLSWLIKSEGVEEKADSAALIISMYGEAAALTVHWIDDYSSRILKPLPANLNGHKALQGVVFNDSFELVPVLNMPELLRKLKSLRDIDRHQRTFSTRKWYQRILLADDSLSTRDVEQAILEGSGYRVTAVKDGIDALQAFKQQQFSMLITDIEMPRMDGVTLIENLRRESGGEQLPVLVISNTEPEKLTGQAGLPGPVSILPKSDFSRNALLTIVQKMIGTAERTYDS